MPGFWRQEDLGGEGWGLSVDPTRARQPVVRGPRDGDKHTGTADQPGGGPEPATRENGGDPENQLLNLSPLRREAGPRVPDTNRARLAGEPRRPSTGLRTPRARRRLVAQREAERPGARAQTGLKGRPVADGGGVCTWRLLTG